MKELEKTKRISIAAVLSILIVLIALLNYQRPKYLYSQNTANTLSKLMETDYLLPLSAVDNEEMILIDVRNPFEYERGHLEGAVNIYGPELLSDQHADFLKSLDKDEKIILLYGEDPDQVLPVFMTLCQLGLGKARILEVNNYFEKDQLITENTVVEKKITDISAFIANSVQKASEAQKMAKSRPAPKKEPAPKQVTPVKKKKKKIPEGGC